MWDTPSDTIIRHIQMFQFRQLIDRFGDGTTDLIVTEIQIIQYIIGNRNFVGKSTGKVIVRRIDGM